MKDIAYVYFMSNKYNNILYVGITNDLARRVTEHKAKSNNSFTSKYKVSKLVYFESTASIKDAIAREKQLKNWKREWKNNLINELNPDWKDLSDSMGIDDKLIDEAKGWYKETACKSKKTQQQTAEIAGQARNDGVNDDSNIE